VSQKLIKIVLISEKWRDKDYIMWICVCGGGVGPFANF